LAINIPKLFLRILSELF